MVFAIWGARVDKDYNRVFCYFFINGVKSIYGYILYIVYITNSFVLQLWMAAEPSARLDA